LWVPPAEALAIAGKEAGSINPQTNNPGYVYYTVQTGDTVAGIASKFKLRSDNELKQLNNLGSDDQLRPGQQLKVAISY
jgi:LysM repeat protein